MLKNNKIGVVAVAFLVTSNMLGSGIYMLPSALASIGGIALIAWGITLLGIIAFALVISKLSTIYPNGAGPYSYAKHVFGNYMGYQTNLIYSIANWVALVSMLPIVTGYLQNIYSGLNTPKDSAIIQIALIWIFTIINIRGAKFVSRIQSFGFMLALVPLLFIAFGGWFWFKIPIFLSGFNPSHNHVAAAVNGSFNDIIWAFIGVESACVVARLVNNPKTNIPLATTLGVCIAAVIYIAVCTVALGIIPGAILSKSSSPISDILSTMFHFHQIGSIVSIIAILDCLGAMSGWFMVTGQTAAVAANDGLFPKIFAKTNRKDIPSIGLIILATFMSIVVLVTISPTALEQFSKIVNMSVLLYLIPYVYSSLSLLTIYIKTPANVKPIYVFLSLISAAFMGYSIFLTDSKLIKYAVVTIILSVPLYTLRKIGANRAD